MPMIKIHNFEVLYPRTLLDLLIFHSVSSFAFNLVSSPTIQMITRGWNLTFRSGFFHKM